jgi:hypothetical protein
MHSKIKGVKLPIENLYNKKEKQIITIMLEEIASPCQWQWEMIQIEKNFSSARNNTQKCKCVFPSKQTNKTTTEDHQ